LQHESPGLQTVEPHFSPAGRQACWVHITPGLVHVPQEALQLVSPAAHMVLPHFSPSIGTHWALPSITWQVVVLVHLTVAQGVIVSRGLVSIGLPLAPKVTNTAINRVLTE
jgi:hypothetical protein